jgi:hypothetical protein
LILCGSFDLDQQSGFPGAERNLSSGCQLLPNPELEAAAAPLRWPHFFALERHMENSFDAVRAMMLENLERAGFVAQIYIDLAERIMRLFPGTHEEQIRTFKESIERQVATNREFMERLLRAKDFQEAFGIQIEYFHSQWTAAAEEATQIGAWIVGLANLPRLFLVSRYPHDSPAATF